MSNAQCIYDSFINRGCGIESGYIFAKVTNESVLWNPYGTIVCNDIFFDTQGQYDNSTGIISIKKRDTTKRTRLFISIDMMVTPSTDAGLWLPDERIYLGIYDEVTNKETLSTEQTPDTIYLKDSREEVWKEGLYSTENMKIKLCDIIEVPHDGKISVRGGTSAELDTHGEIAVRMIIYFAMVILDIS